MFLKFLFSQMIVHLIYAFTTRKRGWRRREGGKERGRGWKIAFQLLHPKRRIKTLQLKEKNKTKNQEWMWCSGGVVVVFLVFNKTKKQNQQVFASLFQLREYYLRILSFGLLILIASKYNLQFLHFLSLFFFGELLFCCRNYCHWFLVSTTRK